MLHLGRATYAIYLLAFTLPLVMAQVWLVARKYGRPGLRAALLPAIAMTVWLSCADHFAIADGIWQFDEARLLGIRLGSVPLEEALFFLMTNLLVALGMALFRGRAS